MLWDPTFALLVSTGAARAKRGPAPVTPVLSRPASKASASAEAVQKKIHPPALRQAGAQERLAQMGFEGRRVDVNADLSVDRAIRPDLQVRPSRVVGRG